MLFILYFFSNPYRLCRRYFNQRAQEGQIYGETPLTTYVQVIQELSLSASSKVVDLGCGRGRLVFWGSCFTSAKMVGVDCVPAFITRAKWISRLVNLSRIEWQCADILEADLTQATHVYLFGTTLEDSTITDWLVKLRELPPGVQVITVSYSLLEYEGATDFELIKEKEMDFAWGKSSVFFHKRK